ncbi:MAG: hypothetical protein U0670_04040 [Anaerolineae bacterium]
MDEHYQLRRLNHIGFVNQSFDAGFTKLTAELQKKGDFSLKAVSSTLVQNASIFSQPIPSTQLMPAPFGWIDVLKKIMPSIWLHTPFQIGKYLIANKQFEKFIRANGYNQKLWWEAKGWEYRERETGRTHCIGQIANGMAQNNLWLAYHGMKLEPFVYGSVKLQVRKLPFRLPHNGSWLQEAP